MEQERFYDTYAAPARSSAFAALMKNVYLWMTLGLAMTGMTAYWLSGNLGFMQTIFQSSGLFFGLIIAELALVWILSANIMRMSFPVASGAAHKVSVKALDEGVVLDQVYGYED